MAAKKATKTTKKAVKATPVKKTSVKKSNFFQQTQKSVLSYLDDLKKNRKKQATLLGAVVLLGLALLLYTNMGLVVAATVNNKPIWRWQLVGELEKQGGKQVLDNLVTQQLILQESQKKGVTVTEEDLNIEVAAIEENLKGQGGDLDSLLTFQGQTREDFRESLRTRILIKKILADKATVNDEEAKKYFDENKTQFPANSKYEDVQGQVKETLVEQKIGQVYQEWIDEVKAASQVNYLLAF
jgi:foldase protein PrsA